MRPFLLSWLSRQFANDLPISDRRSSRANSKGQSRSAPCRRGEIEKWWPIIKQAGIKPEGTRILWQHGGGQ